MKHLCILIFSLSSTYCIYAQNGDFEGSIEYSIRQVAKNEQIDITLYENAFGTSYTSFIKKGSYKQVYKSASTIDWLVYDNNSNRYYFKQPNKDTIYFTDCSKEPDKYIVKETTLEETILGYTCHSLEVSSSEQKQTIFYAPELKLNPDYFAQHKCYAYNLIAKYCKSVYLKYILETESVIATYEATKINKHKLDDSIFQLPDLPLKILN